MAGSDLVLNDGEVVLQGTLKNSGFVLTSQRIIQNVKTGMLSHSLHSIAIDKIDSVRAQIKSNVGAIILALICIAFGTPFITTPAGACLVGGGVLVLLIALATRSKTIEVVSGSSKMGLVVTALSRKQANALIASIEQAKVRREVSLKGGPIPAQPAAAAAPPSGAASVEERLKQLDILKTRGVVSDAEYQEKRRSLIEAL